MHAPHKSRDLARTLVASETDASRDSLQTETATVRVYERLRRQLGAPVGVDGFQTIASRALALARTESPRLNAVRVAANGVLRGFDEVESQTNPEADGEAGVILIAEVLSLFLTLLGETTTMRLIEDLRLQADVDPEPVATPARTIVPVADAQARASMFGDLLVEIDELRNVGDRIETLANDYPGMEDGLINVAENIRGVATVLDVFTLIRSKVGGSQEDPPDPKANGYVN